MSLLASSWAGQACVVLHVARTSHCMHTCVVLAGRDDEAADAGDRKPDRRFNRQMAAIHRVCERAIEQEGGMAAEQQVPA